MSFLPLTSSLSLPLQQLGHADRLTDRWTPLVRFIPHDTDHDTMVAALVTRTLLPSALPFSPIALVAAARHGPARTRARHRSPPYAADARTPPRTHATRPCRGPARAPSSAGARRAAVEGRFLRVGPPCAGRRGRTLAPRPGRRHGPAAARRHGRRHRPPRAAMAWPPRAAMAAVTGRRHSHERGAPEREERGSTSTPSRRRRRARGPPRAAADAVRAVRRAAPRTARPASAPPRESLCRSRAPPWPLRRREGKGAIEEGRRGAPARKV